MTHELESRRASAIIVAGGAGERFGAAGGKQLEMVLGLPILAHTLKAFESTMTVTRVVVVCHPERVDEYASRAVAPTLLTTPFTLAAGGDTRQESVARGLEALMPLSEAEIILVHDGARPLVSADLIDRAVRALAADTSLDGLVVGHPAYDTIKEVSDDTIVGTPQRERLWVAQTPQVFRAEVFARAHALAAQRGFVGTDDSKLVEECGGRVGMFEGPRANIKVTVEADLTVVEAMLSRHGSS
ncbi:MAG: 2-C-methyl-D-erythritol 4-phosphate cytidylyltransferase [Coriobacteriia bacterium]|nr:2-C-methyl-D-erythritol 4-phosphate cytidylyltransferase [Coriobacteriia bacterium]